MHASRPWYFERTDLFRFLRSDRLEGLRRGAEQRAYQRKQLIYKSQDQADTVCLLDEGKLKLSRFDERGRELILDIVQRGELFGEESLGGPGPRACDAEALSEVRVLRVSRQEFLQWMAELPEFATGVARQLTQRLLRAQARMEALAFSSVPARLASTLLRLGEEHGSSLPNGELRIELPLTHQEIASLIASTRETTTTLLGRLRKEGLLRIESRRIILSNPPGLSKRAQMD